MSLSYPFLLPLPNIMPFWLIILRFPNVQIQISNPAYVGLGGLGVTCSPRDPRFAGSNPAEVDGFFQDVKILSTSPPGGTLSWGSQV